MDKHVVLVMRCWNDRKIAISVTNTEIGIAMPLEDFLALAVKESGIPTQVARDVVERRLKLAAVKITDEMKAETARVV